MSCSMDLVCKAYAYFFQMYRAWHVCGVVYAFICVFNNVCDRKNEGGGQVEMTTHCGWGLVVSLECWYWKFLVENPRSNHRRLYLAMSVVRQRYLPKYIASNFPCPPLKYENLGSGFWLPHIYVVILGEVLLLKNLLVIRVFPEKWLVSLLVGVCSGSLFYFYFLIISLCTYLVSRIALNIEFFISDVDLMCILHINILPFINKL